MAKNNDGADIKFKEYDIFRDSHVRYLGYANEVGESFRVIVPVSVVRFSYVVASAYVVADSADKGYKMFKKLSPNDDTRLRKTGVAALDSLIWQGLASVAIPGFTINRICWATRHLLKRIETLPAPVKSWGVVAMGLSCIPFIVKPIDRGTDKLMDVTLRRFYEHS